MPRYTNERTGESVELTQAHFKFQGGEGQIFIIGDTVYKICDSGKMIPEAKFRELSVLDHPRIMCPRDILLDSKRRRVGYTIRAVPDNPKPLAQILSKTFREREGITPQQMTALVKQIRETIPFVHNKKCLQVDGNELNYMVTEGYDNIYFIDVNSYQTPSFPATAIMPSIRDFHCNDVWSELSDWYSFAIISFFMFTGIHPFKGWHPIVTSPKLAMIECMKANKSVLDPKTEFPKGAVYFPFENYIPGGKDGAYMRWYRAILVDGKRLIPPKDFQEIVAIATKVQAVAGTNNFDIYEIYDFKNPVVAFYHSGKQEVVVTKNEVFVNRLAYPLPAKRFRVTFTKSDVPVAVYIEEGQLRLFDLQNRQALPIEVGAEDLMSSGNRVYVKTGSMIGEVTFVEMGNRIVAGINQVATVMEHATEFFQGVAIQQIFGVYFASIFPRSGYHQQIKLPELNGYRPVDAKYEGNVLMVVGINKEGRYDRFVMRFSNDWSSYDKRVIEDVPQADINFTVLDNGICVCLTEEEKIEIFSSKKDSANVKAVQDPVLRSDMRLCHTTGVQFAQGSKLFSCSMRR